MPTFFVLLLFGMVSPLWAREKGLDPLKHPRQYRLDNWNRKNGLPGQAIYRLAQTPDGFLWIGTDIGLYRFDGLSFEFIDGSFANSNSRVYDLKVDKNGVLWVAFHHHIYMREATGFRLAAEAGSIQAIELDRQGNIWAATWYGLVRISPDGHQKTFGLDEGLGSERVMKVFNHGKSVIVATWKGVYRVDGDRVAYLGGSGGPLLATDGHKIVFQDETSGLMQLVGDKLDQLLPRGQNLGDSHCLYLDSRGVLWTGLDGLSRIHNAERVSLALPGGAHGGVEVVMEDSEGQLWMGTGDGTLLRLVDGPFTNWVPNETFLVGEIVGSLFTDKRGRLWFPGTDAIYSVADHQIKTYFPSRSQVTIHTLGEAPDGTIWAGSNKGLLHVQKGELVPVQPGIKKAISGITWSRDGSLWIKANEVLYQHRQGEPGEVLDIEEGQRILQVVSHGDTLWLATTTGLKRYRDGQLEDLPTPGIWANYVYPDKQDRIWFLSDGILALYTAERVWRFEDLPYLSKPLWAISMIEDDLGYFWLTTTAGLFRISKLQLLARTRRADAAVEVRFFGSDQGLKSEYHSSIVPNSAKDGKGHLWFMTYEALVEVDPREIEPEPELPPLFLEEVRLDDQSQPVHGTQVVPVGNHRLFVRYNVVDLVGGADLRFRYRLDPLDGEWVSAGANRDIAFPSLAPGSYRLRLAVSRPDGQWHEMAQPLVIEKAAFFYQTRFFMVFLLGMGTLLSALAYAARLRKARRRAAELGLLVEQRTASLREEQVKTQHLYDQLQTDNERKTRELEDARRLQMAMLPDKPPQVPGLKMAAYMKTATEVSGDYYDFFKQKDGALTVAIGDATGHGLKAGLMTVTAKSHFSFRAGQANLKELAEYISTGLLNLRFKAMFMAMTLLRYQEGRVEILGAGMPPVLVHRASGSVEWIRTRGLPLGAAKDFPYQTHTLHLGPGDVLLLMSDGLSERFNPKDEILGEERVADCLAQLETRDGEEIVATLVALGETWANGRAAEDDIAMVVLVRSEAE